MFLAWGPYHPPDVDASSKIVMLTLLGEFFGFLALLFVVFLLVAAPVVLVFAGFLLPLLMPVLIVVFVAGAAVANFCGWVTRLLDRPPTL